MFRTSRFLFGLYKGYKTLIKKNNFINIYKAPKEYLTKLNVIKKELSYKILLNTKEIIPFIDEY